MTEKGFRSSINGKKYELQVYNILTPFYISNADFNDIKNKKSIKSIVGISPTMVLLFPLLFFPFGRKR